MAGNWYWRSDSDKEPSKKKRKIAKCKFTFKRGLKLSLPAIWTARPEEQQEHEGVSNQTRLSVEKGIVINVTGTFKFKSGLNLVLPSIWMETKTEDGGGQHLRSGTQTNDTNQEQSGENATSPDPPDAVKASQDNPQDDEYAQEEANMKQTNHQILQDPWGRRV